MYGDGAPYIGGGGGPPPIGIGAPIGIGMPAWIGIIIIGIPYPGGCGGPPCSGSAAAIAFQFAIPCCGGGAFGGTFPGGVAPVPAFGGCKYLHLSPLRHFPLSQNLHTPGSLRLMMLLLWVASAIIFVSVLSLVCLVCDECVCVCVC